LRQCREIPGISKAQIAVGVLAVVAFGVAQLVGLAQRLNAVSPVVGVWRLTELTTTGPGGNTNRNPQPGLLIFTTHYYSFNAVTSDSPRSELPATDATDKQRADAFGPYHSTAGTYEIRGHEIVFKRIAAKNPSAMRPGNSETDTFRMEGKDKLWMIEPRQQNPVIWRLTRVE
jgi:hypothetical protein